MVISDFWLYSPNLFSNFFFLKIISMQINKYLFNDIFIYVLAHINTYWGLYNMTNITITVPNELKKELKKHDEVNWSAVMRRAMQQHLSKLRLAEAIAKKSKLTKKDAEEIDRLIKRGIAKEHGL